MKKKFILKAAMALALIGCVMLAACSSGDATVSSAPNFEVPPVTISSTSETQENTDTLTELSGSFHIERITQLGGQPIGLESETSISMEVAAQIGADILEHAFGVNLDGITIYMLYAAEQPEWGIAGQWQGGIMPEGTTFSEMAATYTFFLSAETGEFIEASYNPDAEIFAREGKTWVEIWEFIESLGVVDMGILSEEDGEKYARYALQLAEELNLFNSHATRARVMFDGEMLTMGLNENLEFEAIIMAHVQDEDGNEALIGFFRDSKKLRHLASEERLTFTSFVHDFETGVSTEEVIEIPTIFDWVSR